MAKHYADVTFVAEKLAKLDPVDLGRRRKWPLLPHGPKTPGCERQMIRISRVVAS